MKDGIFKKCSLCDETWDNYSTFLSDPTIHIIGYQVSFENLVAGLLLFNHSCGTTLSLEVGDFKILQDGPIYTERATGSKECPGHCQHEKDLDPCPAKCECAYVRDIIQVIKKWPKSS